MLRAQAGTDFFLLGLTKENVTRLMAGEPIAVKLNDAGLTGPDITIALYYGDTEEQIALSLKDCFAPTTKILDHRARGWI